MWNANWPLSHMHQSDQLQIDSSLLLENNDCSDKDTCVNILVLCTKSMGHDSG